MGEKKEQLYRQAVADWLNQQTSVGGYQLLNVLHVLDVSCLFGPGCGGTLTKDRGSFSSPYFPSNYPPQTTCTWNIEVSPLLDPTVYCSKGCNVQYTSGKQKKPHTGSKRFILWRTRGQDHMSFTFPVYKENDAAMGEMSGQQLYYSLIG